MRFPGRALALNETPPALLDFLGDQLGVSPAVFADYARRDETRREHLIEVQACFLSLRAAARRPTILLLAAIDAATATDERACPSGEASSLRGGLSRSRASYCPRPSAWIRIGRAGARHCAQARSSGDIEWANALAIDGARRRCWRSRFGCPSNAIWLARRLVGCSGRPPISTAFSIALIFCAAQQVDPACRETVHPDRWKQVSARATPRSGLARRGF